MKNLLYLFLFCFSVHLSGQSQLWTRDVSEKTIMSQLEDGKLLLHDKAKISLVDNESGKTIWEHKIVTKTAPEFLDDLPIFFIEGRPNVVMDAVSGKVFDLSKEKTSVIGVTYFWKEGYIVLEMKRNKNLHIININLKNISRSWKSVVGSANKKSINKELRISENPPFITKNGSLVVIDKKYVAIVDQQGNVSHKVDFNDKINNIELNKTKNMLYVNEGKNLHFLDISTGKINSTIATSGEDPMLNILGGGSTISIVQEKEIRVFDAINSKTIGKHVFEDKIKKIYIEENNGNLFVLTKKTIAEVDTSTGQVIKTASFNAKLKDLYHVFGKTIVTSSKGSNPISLETLKFEYPKTPKIPPVYDYVEFGNYTGYIHYEEGDFDLNVVDETGEIIWDKSYNPTFSPSIDVVGEGLLIVSDTKVDYLDFEYGESIWNDKVKVDPSFTFGIDEVTNDMYMYSGKRLYKFDYSTGTLAKSQDKFKFKDFDYSLLQPQLFVLENEIFLKGSNTIFILEKDGTVKYEKSYKRISTGSTILELANIIVTAIAIGTGNANEVSTIYSDGFYYQGGLVDALDISSGIAAQMRYERREKQNKSSNFFPYVFTKLENGERGLVFIDPTNGDERFSIELDKKNPAYIVDDIGGVLYHLGNETLVAYNLNPSKKD